MPSRKCSCHSQASEKTCLLAASPGHSLTRPTWLWYPPRPSEWSRLPCCLIPCRQTLENVALFILLTSLASHPVKITSIPYPKDGSRRLHAWTGAVKARSGVLWGLRIGNTPWPCGGNMAKGPSATFCSSKGHSNLQTDSLPQILSHRKIKTSICPRHCFFTIPSKMPDHGKCHCHGKGYFSLINVMCPWMKPSIKMTSDCSSDLIQVQSSSTHQVFLYLEVGPFRECLSHQFEWVSQPKFILLEIKQWFPCSFCTQGWTNQHQYW